MMKKPFRARKHFRSLIQPMMVDAMKTFYTVAAEADCVLYHVKSLGDYFADQFPGKMIRANVVPAILPTQEFPNPVFSGLTLPSIFNRFTYKLANLGLSMMNPAIREFRTSQKLSPKPKQGMINKEIYGISESFLPKPSDYPANVFFTGFWHGEAVDPLDADIVKFISNGKKTVAVTFGSMPFNVDFNLAAGLHAVAKDLDVNMLIIKGWGFEDVLPIEQDAIKMISHAPFDKLFPMVHAVVHHGGIGTLSSCLRAGVPSFSCPVIYPMGDQHFWGHHAYKTGCAVKPIPLKNLTLHSLTRSISEMLTNQTIRANCKTMAGKLASENGAKNAAQIIEAHFE